MADSPSHPHRPVPRWFGRLAGFGLSLLRPFLPARWLNWLEHGAWFLAVGGFNTLFGYVLFVAFLNLLHLSRVPALMSAYAIGILVSYFNFSRYVFVGGSGRALLRFVPSQILLYISNQGLLELLFRLSGWGEELCQFLLLPVVALLSYIFNRLLVFRV